MHESIHLQKLKVDARPRTVIDIHQIDMLPTVTKKNFFSVWTKCNMCQMQTWISLLKVKKIIIITNNNKFNCKSQFAEK